MADDEEQNTEPINEDITFGFASPWLERRHREREARFPPHVREQREVKRQAELNSELRASQERKKQWIAHQEAQEEKARAWRSSRNLFWVVIVLALIMLWALGIW